MSTRNRKHRRAAAAAAATKPTTQPSDDAFDPASIPLARPPAPSTTSSSTPANPTGKTLVDIIAERQGELLGQLSDTNASGSSSGGGGGGTQFVTVDPRTGEISTVDEGSLPTRTKERALRRAHRKQDEDESEEEEEVDDGDDDKHPIPPVLDTLLLSLPLTTLHLTLAYLAAHQYAQEIELDKLIRESAVVAFPMLTLLIHLAHGHVVGFIGATPRSKQNTLSLLPWERSKLSWGFLRRLLFPPSLRTLVFLPLTIFLGCKLMVMTNDDPYYAVMKHAPAFGTVWIWGVLEMSLGPAVLGAFAPLAWGVWWMGYGIL
ncbi:uncharacterized protein BP01DRAFT_300051 [Aspergillus saccharolyticus JOP 1030-1]|uniref:DUF7719 domain-containing protein n=1 Tax=Aspergillus saccharolyticus JOP 1030-1 TaxID=1450539 RepID=A0A318Z972_9EURO|nr:hypothetical protein BP01DRAFT_300051 [Aspergillus saccharolyticus JOP 1030-1]PYH43856.1 hypothetical protein BP01DRAFT_300051 [Aspergillus saccharolyticus JOP 1030-1]